MINQENRSKAAADPSVGSGQDLQQKAEALARERSARTPEDSAALSPEEIRETLHELRVHQIELEMQNEELRTAQAQIEAGRARYIDLYNLAPVGYCTLSEKGLILEANLTAATLLGTVRGALVKQPISRFILKEDQDIYYLHRKKLFENHSTGSGQAGEPQECELRLVKPDGVRFWAHLTATAAQAEDGASVCRVTISDITERQRAEGALRESEEKHRALVAGLPDTVMRFDREGRHLYVSNNVRELVDMEAAQFIGKTHAELGFPEAQCRLWEESIRRVFDSGAPFETEFTFEGKAGPVIFNWRLVPEQDTQGAVSSVLSISRNVTTHRQAEEQVHRSEEKYRSLFNQSTEGIYLHDLEGRILDVNEMACAQSGYSREEWLGLTIFDGHPREDTTNPTKAEILVAWSRWEPGQRFIVEAEHKRKDGTVYPVEISTGMIFYENLNAMLAIVKNITERKQAEAEREKLHSQLLQSQKMESVGRLAGGVAHDFNNMLGVIFGHVEMAMEQVDPALPLYADLQGIQKAAERSSDLARQLLAFARKQTVSPKILDLNETVEGMLKMLRRLIGEDIHLIWQPGVNLWPVKIDPSQIDQILANLSVNARDAIAGVGKVTIETGNVALDEAHCTDHVGFLPGEYVMLTLNDDGCGMGKETLSHLFEPFFTTKGVGKGTGLGLATVYGIIKQNNGFIDVDSAPDQGTTFKIYLPRHIGKARQTRVEAPQTPIRRGKETLLVVEDEKDLLDLCKLRLERLGYQLLAASTPGEAIRLAQEHTGEIHLLMTDVIMPEMNGRDLAKTLLSLYPNMKRLFMSGYTADVIAHHGVLDDGVHFIQKPFSGKALSAKVREVLDQK